MPKRINTEYDIVMAFEAIEEELIASMINNLDRHRAEELKEGYNWSQWQVEQLASLEEYKRHNKKKYGSQFKDINKVIDALISQQREVGNANQEIAILNAIKKGLKAHKATPGVMGEFFKVNDRKMDALIEATKNDLEKAEYAMLRRADDQYRQVIYNAQTYAASGATYEKAVDMATRDFLAAGIACVEYKNGSRHKLSDYADMCLKTANKRAYLTGEGEKRKEWGIATVIMNKRGNPCPKCLPFVGRVLIDDVWSGGEVADGKYPLMSNAMAAGLYHPRCKDSHTTYFEGISDEPDNKWTKEELEQIEKGAKLEARQQYAKRQEEKCERLAKYSLDPENKKVYKARAEQWGKEVQKLGSSTNSTDGKTVRTEIGQIDISDTNAFVKDFSEKIRNANNENALVIDKYGNAIQFTSTTEDSVSIFDVDLEDAIVLHNHPEANGILSFGEDDFIFLRENQNIKSFKCCNTEYDYSVNVLKDMSELVYNNLYLEAMNNYTIGDDLQHLVFEVLKQEGYVNYERKKVFRD